MMATLLTNFIGSDTFCLTDLERVDRQVADPRVIIGQRIARRWQTPRGALAIINDDPDFGWDITQYVNAKITASTISTAQQQLLAEALKDEQVASGTVEFSPGPSQGEFVVTGRFQSAAGPFTLTMNVDQLTVGAFFTFGVTS